MGAFLALLPTILQLLPSVIQFIEQLHGNAPGQGPAKLSAAVDLVQKLVPEIAPHLTNDPAKLALVNTVISTGVAIMNATGQMPKVATPSSDSANANLNAG